MKLQIIKTDMLEFLKDDACIEKCLNKYQNYESNNWIYELCDGSPFIDTRYQNVNDFELDMSADKPEKTEFENVKRVYESLKFLTNSMASDERIWAVLCLGPYYDYVRYRWNIDNVNSVKQHFFFERQSRRALTRNAMARLWWIGRLTYDDTRVDKYELTKFVCEHSDFIMHFIERNTSNNLHVMRPFLEAMIEAVSEGYQLNTDDGGKLAKYLNLLGGMYVLDFMPEDWIKDKITKKIYSLLMPSATVTESSQNEEKIKEVPEETFAGPKSKLILEDVDDHKKIMIPVKGNKIPTRPADLKGLRVGDHVRIRKMKFVVTEIR